MTAVRVSVIVPAFNNGTTIERALRSVRAQGRDDLEILVVDDASTDDTVERVEALTCEHIVLLRRDRQGGASAARNTGLDRARGDVLAFLDADDEWLPCKLERQLRVLDNRPDVGLVSCNSEFVSPGGSIRAVHHDDHPPVRGAEAWRTLLARNFLPTPTVAVRRACLREVGGFDEDLPVAEDLDLWLRVAQRYPIEVLDDVLVRCHESAQSLSQRLLPRLWSDTLVVIERHMAAQRGRLSAAERRRIRGQRWFDRGGSEYFAGACLPAAASLARAAAYGYRPVKALQVLLRALLRAAVGRRSRTGG